MSLYRQAGRRSIGTVVAALLAGLIVGGLAGYLIGEGGEEEPSLVEAVAELNRDAEPLRLAMGQVEIEYRGTVEGGEVTSPTEYEASRATVERARATLADLSSDLRAIDAAGLARLDQAIRTLGDLVEGKAAEQAVIAQAGEVDRALTAVLGPG